MVIFAESAPGVNCDVGAHRVGVTGQGHGRTDVVLLADGHLVGDRRSSWNRPLRGPRRSLASPGARRPSTSTGLLMLARSGIGSPSTTTAGRILTVSVCLPETSGVTSQVQVSSYPRPAGECRHRGTDGTADVGAMSKASAVLRREHGLVAPRDLDGVRAWRDRCRGAIDDPGEERGGLELRDLL